MSIVLSSVDLKNNPPGPIYLGPPIPPTWAGDTGGTVGDTALGGNVAPNQPSLGSSFAGAPYTGFIVPGGLGAFQPSSGTASGGGSLLPLVLVVGGVMLFLWWRSRG